MSEESNNQQRFCTSCGAEIREGLRFCPDCGASLTPGSGRFEQASHDADSMGPTQPFADPVRGFYGRLKQRILSVYSRFRRTSTKGPIGWFRDLPSIPKFALIGLVGLVLLLILSPVLRIVAILACIVGIAAAIFRATQRRFDWRWGALAVVSLILIPVFGFTSNAFYSGSDDRVATNEVVDGTENQNSDTFNQNSDSLDDEPSFASSGDWDSTEDYIADMSESEEDFETITSDVAQAVVAAENGYMSDYEVVTSLTAARESLDTHRDYFRSTTPPDGFEQYHRMTLTGWDLWAEGLSDIERGFINYDMAEVGEGVAKCEEGTDMITEGSNYLP